MTATVIAFRTRERVRNLTPVAVTPHLADMGSPNHVWARLERRSAGPRRTFWVDAHEHRVRMRTWFVEGGLCQSNLNAIVEAAKTLLPPQATDDCVIEQHWSFPGFDRERECCTLYLRSGRWRVQLGFLNLSKQPEEFRAYIRGLPETDDSTTLEQIAAWRRERDSKAAAQKQERQYGRLVAGDPALRAKVDSLLAGADLREEA